MHKGALLALNDEKKLSVRVRGLPAVRFQIARVLPADVNQLITQSKGDFTNPHFVNPHFNQDNISEVFSELLDFEFPVRAKLLLRVFVISKLSLQVISALSIT